MGLLVIMTVICDVRVYAVLARGNCNPFTPCLQPMPVKNKRYLLYIAKSFGNKGAL